MLSVSSITNVNSTPNINFGSGVQTNYGMQTPSPKQNMVEGGLLTGFVGTVASCVNLAQTRAQSIEKGLHSTKLNYLA